MYLHRRCEGYQQGDIAAALMSESGMKPLLCQCSVSHLIVFSFSFDNWHVTRAPRDSRVARAHVIKGRREMIDRREVKYYKLTDRYVCIIYRCRPSLILIGEKTVFFRLNCRVDRFVSSTGWLSKVQIIFESFAWAFQIKIRLRLGEYEFFLKDFPF